jgi:hypothetical protein
MLAYGTACDHMRNRSQRCFGIPNRTENSLESASLRKSHSNGEICTVILVNMVSEEELSAVWSGESDKVRGAD